MIDTDNHAKFLSHLTASNDAVWIVAHWLQNKGYPVTVNPIQKAKTRDEWKENIDEGDLMVSMRVEVKHLSASFTSRDSCPFGNKFIVCAKHSYDQSKQKPYAYVYLSKDKTYAAIVDRATSSKWYVEEKADSRYSGVKQRFYLCPINLVEFVSLSS